MRNVFTIDADIKLKMLINEPTVVQNDNIRFIINVFDGGQPLSLDSATTVSLSSTRSDRVTVVTPGTKTGTNTVQFDLGTEETKVPGRVEATAQFYDSEGRVSTISFSYRVVKDPTGDGYVPSEREQTLIETVLNDGPLVIQQAQDAANFANKQGQFAQTQANAASEAAQNANDAARSATNAANEANAAAASANNAAASANAAADNANTKATNAQTQADYAKSQGDYAKTQGDYAKAQGDYAKTQGDYAKQVGDENKTRWLTAVNTYADIATTYPNPQLGDTVQTIDDSKIYRWNGTQWVWTQQYNANAITDVQNKIGILSTADDVLFQNDRSIFLEIDKYKKLRFQQGVATITGVNSNGYFRDSEPFVQVTLTGYAQINAPNYAVVIDVISSNGDYGQLIVYDKTQNGFKVKMTGGASSVTFMWTLLNPLVA